MTCYLTILETANGAAATKSFVRRDAVITKLPTVMSKYFTVERRAVETVYELAVALTDLNSAPHKFVIRGEPLAGVDLTKPIRRLKHSGINRTATFKSVPGGQPWVCLDFDKVACPDGIFPARDFENAMIYLADLLPKEFHGVTFWAQLSSSAGINGWNTLSAHLWFMLDHGITDDRLRYWARSINSPIDARLFNAVQPHFTAAPLFSHGVNDPCPVRCGLIKGDRDVVCLNISETNEPEGIEENPRDACSHSKGTGAKTRTRRAQSRPRHSQVGSRQRQDQRPCESSASLYAERPLLSEWLKTARIR